MTHAHPATFEELAFIVLLDLAIVLTFCKIFEEFFAKIEMPTVLGDLLAGILLGPTIFGAICQRFFGFIPPTVLRPGTTIDHIIHTLAYIGIVTLLFIAGIEDKLSRFKKYGVAGAIVGIGGVAASFGLGYALAQMFFNLGVLSWPNLEALKASLPAAEYAKLQSLISSLTHATCLFAGTILCATSVSLTVEVLMELGQLRTATGQVILGAAVFDDIYGLLVLGVVTGIVESGHVDVISTVKLVGLAAAFWLIVVFAGYWVAIRYLDKALTKLKTENAIPFAAFVICIMVAALSHLVNLDPVVGAFAAGLAISEIACSDRISDRLAIIATLFATLFFAYAGLKLDIWSIYKPEYMIAAIAFVAAGIVAKVIGCGIAARLCKFDWIDSMIIGVGMMPRAEVATICALMGLSIIHSKILKLEAALKGLSATHASALKAIMSAAASNFMCFYFGTILLIYVSSFLTPPLLKMLYKKKGVSEK